MSDFERCPVCGEIFDATRHTGAFHCPQPRSRRTQRQMLADCRASLKVERAENRKLKKLLREVRRAAEAMKEKP